MNKNPILYLRLPLCLLAIAVLTQTAAQATLILMDFGRDTDNTSGSTYNNIAYPASGGTVTTGTVGLLDTDGAATGWSIEVFDTGSGNGGNAGGGADVGTAPAAIAGFEPTAWSDSMFANGNNPGMNIRITGLDDALTYDLLFYGSRGNGQSIPDQTWTLTQGTGATPVTHASGLNTTTAIDWPGLNTNGSGEIAFSITGTGPGALALNFGLINGVIPEPSSLGLLMIGLIGLTHRIKRG